MSMSLEERQQSVESSLSTSTSITTKSDTPNQLKHQQTATSLIRHNTKDHTESSPTTNQSCQSATTNSTLISQQPQTDIMAMHNFGPNSSQHEHQLKNQQANSGTESSSWHNNNNSSNNNNNEGLTNTSNNNHVNDSQQSSSINNLNDHKAQATENSKNQVNNRPTLNRHQQQQQQHQPQLQSQSQQYHGIFSPQIPAILHPTLASRVDQVIRRTLHDSPAYTPPANRNNGTGNSNSNAGNNINVVTSTPSSNMPLPSSSSSLIFNTAPGSTSTTSTPQNISGHPASSAGGMMSTVTTTAPTTSIYGPTLSNMGDNLINVSNSNLLAKTSPSHSALAAAAALQSLNQSHVQRSQQQQMAHTQPSPYLNVLGSANKPPSNGTGTPVPQAAHGGSNHQMSKLNVSSMDPHGHPPFASDPANVGSLNFSSRLQANNSTGGNNLGSKQAGQSSGIGMSNMNWQDQVHANGLVSRLPPLHGLNGPLPPYATSSSHSPYGIVNSQLPNNVGSNNGANMIGSDSDTLSKLSSLKNSSGQNNPMQFRDEKSFPMNFPTLLSNRQNQPNMENMRGPPPTSSNETSLHGGIANEKLVVFAYNLLSQGIPGKQQPKKVVHLDDDMRNAIQNGEFYSKYGHIASGIISNQIIVPNFSIIDYLRKDRFVIEEVETIESINSTLGRSDLMCLMELVRQRPWSSDKSGLDLGKLPQFNDIPSMNIGNPNQLDHSSMTNLHHNSPQKGGPFLSSSPRADLLGPQGIDRSRRSSQSPSDISRSHMGNNTSNPKFNIHHHPQQASNINAHQFTSPLCLPNQQQQSQHTSPHANQSSPFQLPLSQNHPLARPPRSHSTIVGLGVSSFNSPYAPPQMRPPPAAHQSSSRPNLAGLDMHLMPAHGGAPNVPVTAHMSSKLPQTPKLQDSLPRPGNKNTLQAPPTFGNNKFGMKETMIGTNMDFQNPSNRFEPDFDQPMAMQGQIGLRHQDINRDSSMKRSTTPHFLQSGMIGTGPNHADVGRHPEMFEANMNIQAQMNQYNPGTLPAHSRTPFNRNTAHSGSSNPSMPPPSMDHRLPTNDLSSGNFNPGMPTSASNESQVKQYNALIAAYQQQIMMTGKVGDNPQNHMNMMGQVPAYMVMNQSGPQRLTVGEPMHVDILQARQPQGQMSSPKLSNQRSIITGSGSSAPTRKSKKPKPSPPATQSSESKAQACDLSDQAQPTGPTDLAANAAINEQQLNLPRESVSLDISNGNNKNSQPEFPDNLRAGADSVESKMCNVSDAPPPAGTARTNVTTYIGDVPDTVGARCSNITADDSIKREINPAPDSFKQSETFIVSSDSTVTKPPEFNDSSLNVTNSTPESKSSTASASSSTVDQPSKYQKLFTKKAWLKNYDLEDQARLNGQSKAVDDNMPVTTRTSSKIEEKPLQVETNEIGPSGDIPPRATVKSNVNVKNGKKGENKKKVKEGKSKKSNATSALKSNKVTPIKPTDNDSEETNASTSDLDDTDETDSSKSTNDKKLRRMPRRKVKLSSDREISDSAAASNKTKSGRDSSDKESVARGRAKKEKINSASSDVLTGSNKRKLNSDDESVKQKSKKLKENVGKQRVDSPDSLPAAKNKKRAGDKFLQIQPCYEILPKSSRCMECRRVRQSSSKGDKVIQSKQASKTNWDDFCRFFEFRKLRYNKSKQIVVAGFSEAADARESDMRLWLPSTTYLPKNITYKVAKFILANIGDEFCKLVLQERAAVESYEAQSDKKTTWKRAVTGLRELCDVCSTTLFNYHYVCDRCGFVVCIDCHQTRSQNQNANETDIVIKKDLDDSKANCENNQTDGEQATVSNKKSKKDSHGWIFCAKNEEHSDDRLTLTKIIAGNCLEEVWSMLHDLRGKLNLGECCCKKSIKISEIKNEGFDNNNQKPEDPQHAGDGNEGSHSTLKGLLLASSDSPMNGSSDTKQQTSKPTSVAGIDIKKESGISTFTKISSGQEMDSESEDDSRQVSAAIEGCIASLAVDGGDTFDDKMEDDFANINDTSSKLCHGDLLVLTHPHHKDNIRLFREHWQHGKPVLVRGVHNRMNIEMWLPQFFLNKFGEYRSDLVDCRNGDIHRQSMRKYWDGFEPSSSKKKFKEDNVPNHIPAANNEEPSAITTSYYSGSALWRLKDWPPGQDFNEILPDHYEDFMNNLPLKSYTTRTGRLNLACRLPTDMLKPDLGPKMYSAYGTTKFPERGTTNLHLDISDAINVMVYVGGAMPFKQGSTEHAEIFDSTINECYIDSDMKDQIRKQKLIPGALWHIFRPSDVDKMREFLNKVSDECNISKEKRIDPIHDQTWYLDQNLLDRMRKEYGVKSYPILQCMGDAILIPAGAPHQVKNLQNCIKVANDFVSPENISYCLKLTNEFRNLPETHINQEDKLQIKNIMYHSVKESIQYIQMFESGKVTLSDESSDEDDNTTDAEDTIIQEPKES